MSEYANKYCVMLNEYIRSFPNHWPITFYANSQDEAKSQGSFHTDPQLVKRNLYEPVLIDDTQMMYTPTQMVFKGGIYHMRPSQGAGL